MSERTKSWWQDMPELYEPSAVPMLTVYPSEAVDTGLLDADGNPIMRSPARIGFLPSVPREREGHA